MHTVVPYHSIRRMAHWSLGTASSRGKAAAPRRTAAGGGGGGAHRRAFSAASRRNTFLGVQGGMGSGRADVGKLRALAGLPDSLEEFTEYTDQTTERTQRSNIIGQKMTQKMTRAPAGRAGEEERAPAVAAGDRDAAPRRVLGDEDVLGMLRREMRGGGGSRAAAAFGAGALDLSHLETPHHAAHRPPAAANPAPAVADDDNDNDDGARLKPPPPPGPPPPSARRRKRGLSPPPPRPPTDIEEASSSAALSGRQHGEDLDLHQLAEASSNADRIAELEQENAQVKCKLAELKAAHTKLERSNAHLRRERDKAVANGRRAALLVGTKFSAVRAGSRRRPSYEYDGGGGRDRTRHGFHPKVQNVLCCRAAGP